MCARMCGVEVGLPHSTCPGSVVAMAAASDNHPLPSPSVQEAELPSWQVLAPATLLLVCPVCAAMFEYMKFIQGQGMEQLQAGLTFE